MLGFRSDGRTDGWTDGQAGGREAAVVQMAKSVLGDCSLRPRLPRLPPTPPTPVPPRAPPLPLSRDHCVLALLLRPFPCLDFDSGFLRRPAAHRLRLSSSSPSLPLSHQSCFVLIGQPPPVRSFYITSLRPSLPFLFLCLAAAGDHIPYRQTGVGGRREAAGARG